MVLLGKERGYLTYLEVKKYLPDDIHGAVKIDGIIGMITDTGIEIRHEDAKIYHFRKPG